MLILTWKIERYTADVICCICRVRFCVKSLIFSVMYVKIKEKYHLAEGVVCMKIRTGIICTAMIAATALLCTVSADVETKVYVNGMRVNEQVIMNNDRTYIPLRAVSEAMGATVEWDEASQSAYVTFTEDDAIAQIVSDVSPSVVTIIGNYDGSGQATKYNNPTMHGSGVIYKSNGYIITNAHVVKDIKNLTVVLNDGSLLPGKVLYSDEDADLAVVKVDKLGLKPVTMADENTIVSGKTAIALGTPISLSMRNTVTKGVVSGVDVALSGSHYKLIQTDAAINPGNSGGPLVNARGELIGVNSSKYASVGIDNMGFAIPIDTVKFAINQFEKNGFILRPKMDITLEDSWEAKIGLPTVKGITVKKSGISQLAEGDVICEVNGIAVHSIADWNEAVKDTYNGTVLKIKYTRGNNVAETEIQG